MKKKILSLALTLGMLMSCCMTWFSVASVSAAENTATVYDPTGVMVSERDNAIQIGWKNPKAEIASVKIYHLNGTEETELTAAEEADGDATFDTASGASNVYAHNLTSGSKGDVHLYKLVFAFRDGHPEREYYIAGTLGKKEYTMESDAGTDTEIGRKTWIKSDEDRSAQKNQPGDQRATGQAYVDLTEKHSGKASLRIVTDHGDLVGNRMTKVRFGDTYDNTALDDAKYYKLSVWVKMENTNTQSEVGMNYGENGLRKTFTKTASVPVATDGDWKCYETNTKTGAQVKKDASHKNVFFYVEGLADNVWIDDFRFMEADDAGFTQNVREVLPYGGFEEYVEALGSGKEVSGIAVQDNRDGSATLTWTNPVDNNYLATRLYQENSDGSETLLGEFYTDKLTAVTVRNLAAETYTYRLVAMDKNKTERDGVKVSVTPTLPDKVIGEITRAEDGSFGVTVQNNAFDDGVPAELILAFYEGTTMVDAISEPVTVQKGKKHTYSLSAKESWKNGTLYVFLWDSIGGMEVLKPCQTYTVTAP